MTNVYVTTARNIVTVTETAPATVVVQQPGIPPGGSVNDVLVKASGNDYSTAWSDSPTLDALNFDVTAEEDSVQGRLAWNADEGTLNLCNTEQVVTQIGQETLLLCRNNTGSDIEDGTAVMFAGSLGNSGRLLIAPMVANGSLPGYVFLGVTTERIATGTDGYVTAFGKVRGVDTRAWPDGTVLWCDPANPGGFTSTEPLAPNLKLPVAAVVNSATNGILMVRWDTGRRMQDLHDVEANGTKNDGDLLHWSAGNNRWEPTDRLSLLEARVGALESTLSGDTYIVTNQ